MIGDAVVINKGTSASIFAYGIPQSGNIAYATKGSTTINGVWTTIGQNSGFLISPINELGTWTLTITDGTNTKTYSVLIDSAEMFDVEVDYNLWLYKDGDECIDVTGGWYYSEAGGDRAGYIIKQSNRIVVVSPQWSDGKICTTNTVYIADYSTVHLEYSYQNIGGGYACAWLGGSTVIDHESIVLPSPVSVSNTEQTRSSFLEISNLSADDSGRFYITKIWLEK